jgi:hypothetical protein
MLFMGVIGTLARQNGGELSSISPNAIVALACIWVAAYSMSAGPLGKSLLFDHGYNALTILSGWAYVADTVTPVLRAKTTSFAAALTCCFGLIFNYTTPIMLSPQQANWGIEIGYFFAGLSALGLVLIYFTVPEVSSLRRDVSPDPQAVFCRTGRAIRSQDLGSQVQEHARAAASCRAGCGICVIMVVAVRFLRWREMLRFSRGHPCSVRHLREISEKNVLP